MEVRRIEEEERIEKEKLRDVEKELEKKKIKPLKMKRRGGRRAGRAS